MNHTGTYTKPMSASSGRKAAAPSNRHDKAMPFLPLSATVNTSTAGTTKRRSKTSERSIAATKDRTGKKHTSKLLPETFEPSPYTVLIGPGKRIASSIGNQRLKVIVQTYLERYSKAKSRSVKSTIVSKVISDIRKASQGVGSFIREDDDGRFWEVDDITAREKVGTVFRNFLCDRYRSSTKGRMASRRKRNERKRQTELEDDPCDAANTKMLQCQAVRRAKKTTKTVRRTKKTKVSKTLSKSTIEPSLSLPQPMAIEAGIDHADTIPCGDGPSESLRQPAKGDQVPEVVNDAVSDLLQTQDDQCMPGHQSQFLNWISDIELLPFPLARSADNQPETSQTMYISDESDDIDCGLTSLSSDSTDDTHMFDINSMFQPLGCEGNESLCDQLPQYRHHQEEHQQDLDESKASENGIDTMWMPSMDQQLALPQPVASTTVAV